MRASLAHIVEIDLAGRPTEERRRSARHRARKPGRIVFNEGYSSITCTLATSPPMARAFRSRHRSAFQPTSISSSTDE